ncbi:MULTISPECIES: hypothetical protein [Haloferax]|uniref:Uncharacterized protein n=1 Tax=Haloferax marinum TaxID=2666143 RepID=A0A6A8G7S2_9EURY|nr:MULTISPECIES: hypothetical protein [Haloferax]KAB1198116.1 hypothetical protein Hfx1150_11525 [Haloferax sp. CBA1150]MRW97189.1 hypothetical protein [Haloferax marinum]
MDFSLEDGLSTKQTAVIIGGAILLVLSIIVATDQQILSIQGAGLLMDGVLTIGTLGYVFLTYSMVSQMRRDIEIRERHQFRPNIIERLESALLPLRRDIQRIRRIIRDGEPGWNGPNETVIGESVYRSYHEVKPGYGTQSIPRFTAHIDVDNGLTYDVYQSVEKYSDTYQEAVYEIQRLILEELDDFEGDSDQVQDFAVLALKVDDGVRGHSLWDAWKDEIVPLRDEIPDLMSELDELRNDVNTACHKAFREIDPVLNETLKEYSISEDELGPDSPPERGDSLAPALR